MSFDFSSIGLRETRATPLTSGGTQSLGQQDFLTLLVTQLKNQDPLNPLENEAFVAQLAQFSTVSGITEMNATLSALSAQAGSDTRSLAPQWLGRTVVDAGGTSAVVRSVGFAADSSITLTLDDGRQLATSDVFSIS